LIVRQIVRHAKSHNLALVTKNKIIMIDEDFSKLAEVREKFSIKSVFWERDNLLFYTTSNHWKYALLSGETGILKSIEEPLHLVKKISNYKYLAFSEKNKVFEIECHKFDELEFKIALLDKDWETVHKLIRDMPRKGKTFIGYLIDKDYSSIALEMVDDKKEKFSLAINSGQFQLAYDICNELNLPEFWQILGEEALKQGIYNVVDVAYQKLQKYEKMSFIFLAQGKN
jgi:coatomer protein complex subunit alpha (xenin)